VEPEMLLELLHEELVLGRVLAAGDGGEDPEVLRQRARAQKGRCERRQHDGFCMCHFISSLSLAASLATAAPEFRRMTLVTENDSRMNTLSFQTRGFSSSSIADYGTFVTNLATPLLRRLDI